MTDRGYPMVVHALSEEEGGGFLATAPDLRGCVADGDTAEAAIRELHAAIEEWIDEAVRLNRTVPLPGEYGKRLRNERAEISSLLNAQEKLIKVQDEILKAQKEEINLIRSSFDSLLKKNRNEQDPWISESGAAVAILALGARKIERLPN